MRKLTRQFLAFILTFLMIFGVVPANIVPNAVLGTKAKAADIFLTADDVTEKINNFQDTYKNKYWNGKKNENQLTTAIDTNKTDDSSLGLQKTGCPSSYKESGCTSNTFNDKTQCQGFAFYMDYALFRAKPKDDGGSGYTKYTGNSCPVLQPGDHIHVHTKKYGDHDAIVWKIENEKIYVVDVWGSKTQKHLGCKINFSSFYYADCCYDTPDKLLKLVKNNGKILRPTKYVVKKSLTETTVDKTLYVKETGKYSKKAPYERAVRVKQYNRINEAVHAKKSVKNIYGNLWYQLDDNSWVYSGNFWEKEVAQVNTYASKSSNIKTNKKITSLPVPVVIPEDDFYTIPGPAPILDGYVFMGYSTEEKAEKAEYQIGQKIKVSKGGLNLYTVWKQEKVTIDLSADSCNLDITNPKDTSKTTKIIKAEAKGELSKNTVQLISVTSSNDKTVTAEVTDNKYSSFLLWDKLTANIKITAKSPGNARITVTVKDIKNNDKVQQHINVKVDCIYKITYYTDTPFNGGKLYDQATQEKSYGKDLTLGTYIPEKKNYAFIGWADENHALLTPPSVQYGPGDLYKDNHDISFYPVWVKDDQIKWTPPVDGVLTIGGSGEMPAYSKNKAPWQEYKDSIRKVVIEDEVTSIGSNAFYCYTNLEEVVIPEGVTYIGNNAFYNTGLREVVLPYSFRKFGNDAFGKCKNLSGLEYREFMISRGTARRAAAEPTEVEIGAFAFEGCTSLKSVVIPSATKEIGAAAFKGCSNLEQIELPKGLETIDDSAFFGCSSLSKLEIPDGVKKIGDNAFDGCEELPAVLVLPEGLETIGDGAFSGCSSITKAEIPERVVEYGDGIFTNCSSLIEPVLPNNMTIIPDGMFVGCTALTEPQIPESVEVYGDGCFRECSLLKPVVISDNVNAIGNDCFNDCDSIDKMVIPSSVTTIGDYAFSGCDALKDVELNEGLTVIGAGAFSYCEAMEYIAIPASCRLIESGAFMECSSLMEVDIPETDIAFDNYVFAGCSSLGEIQFPESTTAIGDYMFNGCSDSMNVACFSTSIIYEKAVGTIKNVVTIVPVESISFKKTEISTTDRQSVALTPVISPANATDTSVSWFVNHPEIASVDENGFVTIKESGEFTVTATTNDGKYTASCDIVSTIPVRGIQLEDSEIDVYAGDKITMHYTFEPFDATNSNVSFLTSDETVANVSPDGEISIKKPGNAVVTVTTEDGGYISSCTINAEEYISVEEIVIDNADISLRVGETTKINASVLPANATDPFVSYLLSEEAEDIIEIDENGSIKALKPGVAVITITAGGVEDKTCTIIVTDAIPIQGKVKSVSVADVTVNYKSSAVLKPTITIDEGVEYTVKYESSNPSVVSVDSSGKLTGAKKGTATITCTVTDKYGNTVQDTCKVTVKYTFFQWLTIIFLLGFIWY